MTSLYALVLIVSVVCGGLALLGWLVEKKEGPLEKLDRRFPRTKGFER